MRILGYGTKKTTAKIYVDDIKNPTFICTGNFRHQSPEFDTAIPVPYMPIISLDFKVPDTFEYIASGIAIEVEDVETGKTFFIYNDTIMQLFKLSVEGGLFIEDEIITAPFIVTKTGNTVGLSLATDEDLRTAQRGIKL